MTPLLYQLSYAQPHRDVLVRGFNTLSGAKIPHAASLSPSIGYSGVFQDPVARPACAATYSAPPQTAGRTWLLHLALTDYPLVISPSTGLAHPMPVRVLSTEARPSGGQPCIRSPGAAFAMRDFGVPPCAACLRDRFGPTPYPTLAGRTEYPVFLPISKPFGRRPLSG